ncbi:alpha/beta hydrolase family protein [Candidatus Foliamicus sp.]
MQQRGWDVHAARCRQAAGRAAAFAILGAALVWPPLSQAAGPAGAYKTESGPHAVRVIDNHVLPAADGQRRLRARIVFPVGEEKAPLVIFSHGFACYRENYSDLTDHWASHGYVVVQPEHPDSPTSERRLSAADAANLHHIRISDIGRVLDALVAPGQEIPGLADRIDYTRRAMAGHSFGAMITQIIWGQPLRNSDGTGSLSYALDFDAAIVMSGPGPMPQMADGAFSELPGPLLVTGGTRDTRNVGDGVIQPWEWRMQSYEASPPGHKYSVVLEEGDHYLGGRICREDRGGPENRGGAQDIEGVTILAGVTTAFLDAWLNSDPAAIGFLEEFDQHAGLTSGRARFARR